MADVTITSAAYWTTLYNNDVGGRLFDTGTALYMVTHTSSGSPYTLEMHKSSDAGQNWSSVGTYSTNDVFSFGLWGAYSTNDNRIVFVWASGANQGNMVATYFNCGTDAWSGSTVTGPAYDTTTQTYKCNRIYYPDSASSVGYVFHMGPGAKSMGNTYTDVGVTSLNSSGSLSWGTTSAMANPLGAANFYLWDAVALSSTNMFFWTQPGSSASASGNRYMIHWNGSAQTNRLVSSSAYVRFHDPIYDGTTLSWFGNYNTSGTAQATRLYESNPSSSSTWSTSENISSYVQFSSNFPSDVGSAYASNTLYVLDVINASPDFYVSVASRASGSWTGYSQIGDTRSNGFNLVATSSATGYHCAYILGTSAYYVVAGGALSYSVSYSVDALITEEPAPPGAWSGAKLPAGTWSSPISAEGYGFEGYYTASVDQINPNKLLIQWHLDGVGDYQVATYTFSSAIASTDMVGPRGHSHRESTGLIGSIAVQLATGAIWVARYDGSTTEANWITGAFEIDTATYSNGPSLSWRQVVEAPSTTPTKFGVRLAGDLDFAPGPDSSPYHRKGYLLFHWQPVGGVDRVYWSSLYQDAGSGGMYKNTGLSHTSFPNGRYASRPSLVNPQNTSHEEVLLHGFLVRGAAGPAGANANTSWRGPHCLAVWAEVQTSNTYLKWTMIWHGKYTKMWTTATSGSFQIEWPQRTATDQTNSIAYNASAATIKSELESLTNGTVNYLANLAVSGTGTTSDPWLVDMGDSTLNTVGYYSEEYASYGNYSHTPHPEVFSNSLSGGVLGVSVDPSVGQIEIKHNAIPSRGNRAIPRDYTGMNPDHAIVYQKPNNDIAVAVVDMVAWDATTGIPQYQERVTFTPSDTVAAGDFLLVDGWASSLKTHLYLSPSDQDRWTCVYVFAYVNTLGELKVYRYWEKVEPFVSSGDDITFPTPTHTYSTDLIYSESLGLSDLDELMMVNGRAFYGLANKFFLRSGRWLYKLNRSGYLGLAADYSEAYVPVWVADSTESVDVSYLLHEWRDDNSHRIREPFKASDGKIWVLSWAITDQVTYSNEIVEFFYIDSADPVTGDQIFKPSGIRRNPVTFGTGTLNWKVCNQWRAYQDGDILHIVWLDHNNMADSPSLHNAKAYYYSTFNMLTQAWGVQDQLIQLIEYGPGSEVLTDGAGLPYWSYSNFGWQDEFDIVKRSDGRIVVIHAGDAFYRTGTTTATSIAVSERSTGGVWSKVVTNLIAGIDSTMKGNMTALGLGAADRVHIFYSRTTTGGYSSGSAFYHISLDSSNNLDTAQYMDPGEGGQRSFVSWVDGASTKCAFGYTKDLSFSRMPKIREFTSQANPTITSTHLIVRDWDNAYVDGKPSVALWVNDGKLWCFHYTDDTISNDVNQFVYWVKPLSGSWSVDATSVWLNYLSDGGTGSLDRINTIAPLAGDFRLQHQSLIKILDGNTLASISEGSFQSPGIQFFPPPSIPSVEIGYTTDAILLSSVTRSYTVDAVLAAGAAENILDYSTSAVLVSQITLDYSVDAVVALQPTVDYSVDAVLTKINVISPTIQVTIGLTNEVNKEEPAPPVLKPSSFGGTSQRSGRSVDRENVKRIFRR